MNLQGPQSHSAAGCGNPQPWWPPICVCSYIQYKLGIQSQFLSFNFSVVLWFLASQGFCDSSLAYGSNPHIVCCPSGSTLVQLWQNEIQRQELCSPKVPAPLINHCKYHTVLKSVVVRQVAFSEGGQPKRSTYFPQWRFSSKIISPNTILSGLDGHQEHEATVGFLKLSGVLEQGCPTFWPSLVTLEEEELSWAKHKMH